MDDLNDNHKARLLATFTYVDRLLSDILRISDASQARNPFLPYGFYFSPDEEKAVTESVAFLRANMLAILKKYNVPLPASNLSAVYACRILFRTVAIAIEELVPKHMQGYGELSDDAQIGLNEAITLLLDSLQRVDRILALGGKNKDFDA